MLVYTLYIVLVDALQFSIQLMLKGRGLGWTGPKRADLPRVDLVMSRGNWRQVDSGGQGAWGGVEKCC